MSEYPTDCPCGSRCDGHAIGAPEDPGCEWCGVATTEGEVIETEHLPGWMACPNCGQSMHLSHNGTTAHSYVCPAVREMLGRYRSPREEWVRAWKVKQETHR